MDKNPFIKTDEFILVCSALCLHIYVYIHRESARFLYQVPVSGCGALEVYFLEPAK